MSTTIQSLLLGALMSSAVWYDWRSRRIPNRLLQGFSSVAVLLCLLPAGPALATALGGAFLGAVTFIPLYLMGRMGGGDIKLMATTGLLVGFDHMVDLCLAVALCGGVLALWWSWRARIHAWPVDALQARMPYALAIAAGTLMHGLHLVHQDLAI